MAALACGAIVAGIDSYYPDTLLNESVAQLGLTNLVVEDAATFQRLSATNQSRFKFVVYLRDEVPRDHGDRDLTTLRELRSRESGSIAWNPKAQPEAPWWRFRRAQRATPGRFCIPTPRLCMPAAASWSFTPNYLRGHTSFAGCRWPICFSA